jgi:hypothetical protein
MAVQSGSSESSALLVQPAMERVQPAMERDGGPDLPFTGAAPSRGVRLDDLSRRSQGAGVDR